MGKSARWLKKFLGIKKSEKSKDKGTPSKKGDPIDHVPSKKSDKQKHVVITPPAPLPAHVYDQIRKFEQTPAPQTTPAQVVNPPVKKEQKVQTTDIPVEIPPAAAAAKPEIIVTQPEQVAAIEDADFDHVGDSFEDIEGVISREDLAAVKIQKAFKSYLARRAYRALKGVIRLQALARGHAVRRQAAATLRCIQAIVRVQAIFRGRQSRISEEGLAVQYLLERYRQQTDSWQFVNQESYNEIYRHRKVPGESEPGFAFQRQLQQCTPKPGSPIFVDSALQSDSGWVWLQRWTVAQPWAIPSAGASSPGNFIHRELEDPYEEYPNDNGKQVAADEAVEEATTSIEPETTNNEEGNKQAPTAAATFTDDDFPVGENSFEVSEPITEQPATNEVEAAAAAANGHHSSQNDEEDEEDYEEELEESDHRRLSSSASKSHNVDHHNSTTTPTRSTRSVPSYMAATQSAKAKVRAQSPKSASSPTAKQKRFAIPGPNSKVEPRRLSLPGSYGVAATSDASPRRLSVSGAVSNGRLAEAARSPRLISSSQIIRNGGKSDSAFKHSNSEVRRSSEMRRSFKY